MNNGNDWKTWILPLAAIFPIAYLWWSDGRLSWPPSLDFTGGVRLEYQINRESAVREGLDTAWDKKDALQRSQEVFLFRLRGFDLSEISVKPLGDDRLVIEVPGAEAIEHVKDAIGRASVLTFRVVTGPVLNQDGFVRLDPDDRKRYFRQRGQNLYFPVGPPLLDASDINYSGVMTDLTQATIEKPAREIFVRLALQAPAVEKFEHVTTQHFQERLAICLDNQVESAPMIAARGIREPIITGYEKAAAKDLVKILRNGPLPVSFDLVTENAVSPGLADNALRAGLIALLVAAGFVFLVLVLSYLDHPALLATFVICLGLEGALLFLAGRTSWLTLNMASLSGIIVLLGISVDNLILIFEEFRHIASHEVAIEQRRWLSQLQHAFESENGVILMANLSTCAALAPLYFLGGPIRNLIEVLLLGIIVALVANMWFARRLLQHQGFVSLLENAPLFHRPIISAKIDLYRLRWPLLAVYLGGLTLAAGLLWTRGVEKGLDFRGGMEIVVAADQGLGTETVRRLSREYLGERSEAKRLQSTFKDRDFRYVIHTVSQERLAGGEADAEDGRTARLTTSEEFLKVLRSAVKVPVRLESVEELGPTVVAFNRSTVFWSALAALALLAVFIMAEYGVVCVLPVVGALVCDAVIATGTLVVLSIPASIAVVAALLTVLGYSINDSIVLCGHFKKSWSDWETRFTALRQQDSGEFERIRDDPEGFLGTWVSEAVRLLSSRVILTSLTTLGVSAVLWVFGRDLLRDFGAIIMVGTAFGTLSSVSLVVMGLVSIQRARLRELLSGSLGPPSPPRLDGHREPML